MKYKFLLFSFFVVFLFTGCGRVENNFKDNKTIEQRQEEPESYTIEEQVDVPIIIYHQIRDYTVNDSSSARQFIMPTNIFEEQIKYLYENGFETVYLNDLNLYFEGKKNLPEKPVIITFDDGSIGQYQNAFPVLKKYNFVATFYVFTHAMDKNNNYMSWGNLKEMSDAGMDIGSHGYLHENLKKSSFEKAKIEIERSRDDLRENLGIEPLSFSYPFGEYNEQIIKIVKGAGYTTARSILNGYSHTTSSIFSLHAYFAPNNLNSFKNIIE